MYGLELEYEGIKWGFAFISADSRLYEAERRNLLRQSVEMYLLNEEQRDVEGDRFEGRIYNTKKHGLLGAFAGREFKAELETDFGKVKLGFLVTEYIDPKLN